MNANTFKLVLQNEEKKFILTPIKDMVISLIQ